MNIQLKTGDVILFRTALSWNPISWVAWIIRKIIKYNYNHVGIIINNWDVNFLNEANQKGLTANLASYRLKNHKIKILRLKKENNIIVEKDFATRANSILGVTKYDLLTLCFYQPIYQLTGLWLKKDRSDKKMVCSEYAAWCHQELFNNWDKIDPDDFEQSELFDVIYYN